MFRGSPIIGTRVNFDFGCPELPNVTNCIDINKLSISNYHTIETVKRNPKKNVNPAHKTISQSRAERKAKSWYHKVEV